MIRPVLLAAILVLSLVAVSYPVGAQETCSAVTHDGLRFDEALVEEFNETSSAESSTSNTRVRIEETDAFVRIDAENPNGYCVDMTVEVSPEIVSPAELGTVNSVDRDSEAKWRAVHDFDREETITEITFTVEADSSVRFAPSQIRVRSLSWTGEAKEETSSLWGRFSERLDRDADADEDLEQRTYHLAPGEEVILTIPLESDDGREVEDWQASYRIGGGDDASWRPITQNADRPVFYRNIEGGIQLVFNEPRAEVEFTANPTRRERMTHDWRSYTASWSDVLDIEIPWLSMIGGGYGDI